MINKERIKALADRIESIPDQDDLQVGFNMRSYYEIRCGTTACIAGHAILMFGTEDQVNRLVNSLGGAFGDAMEILGLDVRTAQDLFNDMRMDSITAVYRLRRIAAKENEVAC